MLSVLFNSIFIIFIFQNELTDFSVTRDYMPICVAKPNGKLCEYKKREKRQGILLFLHLSIVFILYTIEHILNGEHVA